MSFDCELGIEHNNMDRAYGFLLNVQILCERNFKNMIVIRDSIILIHQMVKNMIPKNADLGKIVSQIQHQMRILGEVSYYHVFIENNGTVDELENNACYRSRGEARMNEEIFIKYIT